MEVQKLRAMGSNRMTNKTKMAIFNGVSPLICSIPNIRSLINATVASTSDEKQVRRAKTVMRRGSRDKIFITAASRNAELTVSDSDKPMFRLISDQWLAA